MNDYQFTLAKIEGDFVWGDHKDMDEVFFVLEGNMTIECRDGNADLSFGEMSVAPEVVEHKSFAKDEYNTSIWGIKNT